MPIDPPGGPGNSYRWMRRIRETAQSEKRPVAISAAVGGAGLAFGAAELQGHEQAVTLLLGLTATFAVAAAILSGGRLAVGLTALTVTLACAAFINIWVSGNGSGPIENAWQSDATAPTVSETPKSPQNNIGPTPTQIDIGSHPVDSSPKGPSPPQTRSPERIELYFTVKETSQVLFDKLTISIDEGRRLTLRVDSETCSLHIANGQSGAAHLGNTWYRITRTADNYSIGNVELLVEEIGRKRPKGTLCQEIDQ
jgi:hypothetical protein